MAKRQPKLTFVKTEPIVPIKLDCSYGDLAKDSPFTRPEGFDPSSFPWSLKDESVEEVHSAYLFQKLPAKVRGPFMNEVWRVLVPGGKITIITPYWNSSRAIQDPFAEWPPLSEQSFLYFNKQFREDNKLNYNITCDFDFVYGYTLDGETASRTDDTRPFWIKHYTNAVQDLHVSLTKRS